MYTFAKYFWHVCLDIMSSSWVEADNASQMNSSTGPRSHMGVALSCKATTNLANLRMKRNDQEFARSMATTQPKMTEKYKWSLALCGLHDHVFDEAISIYTRINKYYLFRTSATRFYVKTKEYKTMNYIHLYI